uniref:Uncharacterized protein n=1 Tax=Solanum lycopersicum TaxID=4081 RepID=A0A3Q7EJD8_SOLLC
MYSFLAFTWMDGRYLYFRLYFFLAIGDDYLRETAYEILLAAAGSLGFLEAMDVRTRLGLLNAMVGKVGK